jgi:hypothetical protein
MVQKMTTLRCGTWRLIIRWTIALGLMVLALASGLLWIASWWFPYTWHFGERRPGESFWFASVHHYGGWVGLYWETDAYDIPTSRTSVVLGRVDWTRDVLNCHLFRRYDRWPTITKATAGQQQFTVARYGAAFPAWLPLAVCGPFAIAVFGRCCYQVWRRRSRYRGNRCVACGYSLAGNVSGRCPECGHEGGAGLFCDGLARRR